MNTTMKKKLTTAVALAMATLTVVACSNSSAVDTSSSSKVETTEVRDSIIIATESEPPTLHPFDHKSVASGYMNELTFDTLYTTSMTDLSPEPKLLTGYENLSDTQWQFTVRENVYFHDGTLMTAEDVVASMEYAKTNINTIDYTSFWTNLTVVDDYTVLLETEEPYAGVLTDLCNIEVLPKALIDAGNDFNANPIGTGPYKFVSQTLGDNVVFEWNENYYDTENMASIQHMTWKVIPEGSGRTIALEAGEVDLIIEVESTDLPRLETTEGVSVVRVDGTRHNFMTMNTTVAPFDNENFRKALNAATDRSGILTVAVNGEGTENIAQSSAAFAGYTTENAVGYDLEKAKEYLAASGISTEDLSFECIVHTDVNRRTAEVLQSDFAEIGVTMNIVSMDLATYLSNMLGGDYDTAIAGYTSSNLPLFLQGRFHSSSIDAGNASRLVIPEVDALIEEAKTELDADTRTAMYEEVISILNDKAPCIPLYDTTVTRAFNSDLGGVEVSATGKILYSNLFWKE